MIRDVENVVPLLDRWRRNCKVINANIIVKKNENGGIIVSVTTGEKHEKAMANLAQDIVDAAIRQIRRLHTFPVPKPYRENEQKRINDFLQDREVEWLNLLFRKGYESFHHAMCDASEEARKTPVGVNLDCEFCKMLYDSMVGDLENGGEMNYDGIDPTESPIEIPIFTRHRVALRSETYRQDYNSKTYFGGSATYSINQPIKFCPLCGTDLSKFAVDIIERNQ